MTFNTRTTHTQKQSDRLYGEGVLLNRAKCHIVHISILWSREHRTFRLKCTLTWNQTGNNNIISSNGTKRSKTISCNAWNSLVEYPSKEFRTWHKGESKGNMFNPIFKKTWTQTGNNIIKHTSMVTPTFGMYVKSIYQHKTCLKTITIIYSQTCSS